MNHSIKFNTKLTNTGSVYSNAATLHVSSMKKKGKKSSGKKWIVIVIIVYYCVLLNIALFLSVGLLRPPVSGMTLCWPFNPHYGELSYVFMLLLLMWIDELNEWSASQLPFL